MSSRGITRERQLKKRLIADGWWCIRAAASLGDADLVALKAGLTPRFIEVKSNTDGGPYKNFGPKDRTELRDAARMAGAEPWLVYWPPRKDPRWIEVEDWPAEKTAPPAPSLPTQERAR